MFFLLAVSWPAFLAGGPGPKADRPVPVQVQIVTLKQLALLVDRDEIPCSWRLMSTGCLLNISGNVFTLDEAAQGSVNYAKKSAHKQVVLKVLGNKQDPDGTPP